MEMVSQENEMKRFGRRDMRGYFGETNVERQGVACDINHFHIHSHLTLVGYQLVLMYSASL